MSAQPDRLTVRDDQMVFAIPSEQNGIEEIIYAASGDELSRALGLDPRRQRTKLGAHGNTWIGEQKRTGNWRG